MSITGTVRVTGNLYGTLNTNGNLSAEVKQAQTLNGIITVGTKQYDYYPGPYEFTPTQLTQTVSISGKTASTDITINPIPSNYGLITWDGSALTVS